MRHKIPSVGVIGEHLATGSIRTKERCCSVLPQKKREKKEDEKKKKRK
jgi:hypothetical protein